MNQTPEKLAFYESIFNQELREQFERYLSLLYEDLRTKDNGLSKNYVGILTFLKYCKLPGYLGRRLFETIKDSETDDDPFFPRSRPNYISCVSEETITGEAFVKGLSKIYLGSQRDHLELIHQLLDVNDSGFLTRDATRILLNHSLIID